MAQRTCSVDGCNKKFVAKGLCGMHYQRVRSGGSLVVERRERSVCCVADCARFVNSYGYCAMHWLRLQRSGDVADPGSFSYSETGLCTVQGCDAPHVAKGYCNMHYLRAKKGSVHLKEDFDCERCGERFTRPFKGNPKAIRFCSHACRYATQLDICRERYPELYARNVLWRKNNADSVKAIMHRRRAAKTSGGLFRVSGADIARLVSRYGNECAYCRVAPYEHLDHVIPLARGGQHRIGNLLPACEACNLSKAAKLVSEWRLARPVPRRFRNRG